MNQTMQDSSDSTTEQSPWESILSQLDSYIKSPKLATPDTLSALKSEVEDLKSSYEGEETSEGEPDQSDPMSMDHSGKGPGLVIAIGKARGK